VALQHSDMYLMDNICLASWEIIFLVPVVKMVHAFCYTSRAEVSKLL
jgi:hypothetical protein